MPTSKIRKDAREGKGSVKKLEKDWSKAKEAAKGEGKGGNDWPLTMYIYEKETGSKPKKKKSEARLSASRALARLKASNYQ